MKKFIMILLCALVAFGAFAQSSNFVTKVIATDKVTYGQVAYLTACALNLVKDNASEQDAATALAQKYPEFTQLNTQADFISAKDFSFVCTKAWNIKTSLLYMIAPIPRYAFREMKAQGYFDAGLEPGEFVPGRQALLIIADCSEKFGGKK